MKSSTRSSQTVFISGASSGLGLETAKLLAKAGFKVYGGARSFPEGIANHPAGFKTVSLDVLSQDSVNQALGLVEKDSCSSVDILINCVGRGLAGAVEDTPVAEAQALFDLNVFGALRTIQAVLPGMRKRRKGLIINIGSLSARVALPYQAFYSASKAALASMSDALAAELRPLGIFVALIEPGDFTSGFTAKRMRLKSSPDYAKDASAMLAGYEKSENAGMPALKVAKAIASVAMSGKPKFRHTPAALNEKLGADVKPVLPKIIFERILASNYKS